METKSAFQTVLAVLLLLSRFDCAPVPDSADIIPLMDGLAYGGIPYGSVSGQLSDYFGPYEPIAPTRRKTDFDDYNLQNL